jgi:Flp pilus assembly protein TadD
MLLLTACASAPRTDGVSQIAAGSAPRIHSEQERKLLAAQERKLLDAGEHALISGDVKTAFTIYSSVLNSNPGQSEALLGIGECQLHTNNPSEALNAFKKVEGTPMFHAKSLQGQGLAYLALGKVDEAEGHLRIALTESSNLWPAWAALAQIYDSREDWNAAQAAYSKALELNANSGEIYNNLGVSLLMQKRYAEARDAFLSALDRAPGLEEAQANLRLAHAWNGEYAKALASPGPKEQAQILNNVGFIAMERGDYDEASRLLTEAIRVSPTFYKRATENLTQLRRLQDGGKG